MRKMNHILYKPGTLLLLWAMLSGTFATAQDHTEKRSVSRTYPATRETTLEVQNKYGKIQVLTWERDSVLIEVPESGQQLSDSDKIFWQQRLGQGK